MESWKLLELRSRVTRIDTQIVALLAERLLVTRDIQKLKQMLQLPPEDLRREYEVMQRVRSLAREFAVPIILIEHVWPLLFSVSKQLRVKESNDV